VNDRTASDRTARARIRDAALKQFARRGVAAASLRDVAVEAGVAHGLVRYHFGNKEGLRQAVEDEVLRRLHAAAELQPAPTPAAVLAARRRFLQQLLASDPDALLYLARGLLEQTPAGMALFRRFAVGNAAWLGQLTAAGVLRPVPDAAARDLLLSVLTFVPVLLRPLIERLLGADALDRWLDAEADLLTNGLFRGQDATNRS
jgi:AcrR family transcriptional regulator